VEYSIPLDIIRYISNYENLDDISTLVEDEKHLPIVAAPAVVDLLIEDGPKQAAESFSFVDASSSSSTSVTVSDETTATGDALQDDWGKIPLGKPHAPVVISRDLVADKPARKILVDVLHATGSSNISIIESNANVVLSNTDMGVQEAIASNSDSGAGFYHTRMNVNVSNSGGVEPAGGSGAGMASIDTVPSLSRPGKRPRPLSSSETTETPSA
jgi:hypothetical protein